jgi:hypothetical protein
MRNIGILSAGALIWGITRSNDFRRMYIYGLVFNASTLVAEKREYWQYNSLSSVSTHLKLPSAPTSLLVTFLLARLCLMVNPSLVTLMTSVCMCISR